MLSYQESKVLFPKMLKYSFTENITSAFSTVDFSNCWLVSYVYLLYAYPLIQLLDYFPK